MFQAHSAHHQERQIVSIQPLVTIILCWLPSCVPVGSRLIWYGWFIDYLCWWPWWPCRVHTTRPPTQVIN